MGSLSMGAPAGMVTSEFPSNVRSVVSPWFDFSILNGDGDVSGSDLEWRLAQGVREADSQPLSTDRRAHHHSDGSIGHGRVTGHTGKLKGSEYGSSPGADPVTGAIGSLGVAGDSPIDANQEDQTKQADFLHYQYGSFSELKRGSSRCRAIADCSPGLGDLCAILRTEEGTSMRSAL